MNNSPYDAVPYQSNPFAQSQPEQLAVMAHLFGLQPMSPSSARVLELGCSAGGNIIPLAARYPGASFLGIDLSERQVAMGKETIAALALKNIDLRHADIASIKPGKTKFDYIICHGVFSWVPPEVQEAIFRVIQENLSPNGVAYVSYNTYPGWKMREVVRDAMMFHAGHLTDPTQKLEQARAMIRFTEEISDANTAFGKMLREEAAIVGKSPDYYLFHEHLEAHNRPCYFREFIARAQAFQLGFLGESSIGEMAPQRFGEKVFGVLQKVSGGNILATEQYMDFFRNRSFRQTLLVHAESMKQIKRSISPESLRTFQFSCAFAPSQPIRPETVDEVEFRDLAGRSAKVAAPLVKSLLLTFAELFPGSLSYEALMTSTRAKLQGKVTFSEQDFQALEDTLMRFALDGVVRLHVESISSSARTRTQPKAFAPARHAISAGATTVTNVRHENVALNQMDARTLALLDGQTSREKLASVLVGRTVQKEFTLMRDNVQLTQPEEIRPIVEKLLTESLEKFDRWALLVP
jgi:methyltransferase-like protein/SAM-dependent methyltransferase